MSRAHWITMHCPYCKAETIGAGQVAARAQLRAHERACPARKKQARS